MEKNESDIHDDIIEKKLLSFLSVISPSSNKMLEFLLTKYNKSINNYVAKAQDHGYDS